jgi:hypothetical protein
MFLKVSMGLGLATAAITSTLRADPGLLPNYGEVANSAAPAAGIASIPVQGAIPALATDDGGQAATQPDTSQTAPRAQMSPGLKAAIDAAASGSNAGPQADAGAAGSTGSSTTQTPTTAAPDTAGTRATAPAPVAKAPVVKAPVSQAPVTKAPVAKAPTSQAKAATAETAQVATTAANTPEVKIVIEADRVSPPAQAKAATQAAPASDQTQPIKVIEVGQTPIYMATDQAITSTSTPIYAATTGQSTTDYQAQHSQSMDQEETVASGRHSYQYGAPGHGGGHHQDGWRVAGHAKSSSSSTHSPRHLAA